MTAEFPPAVELRDKADDLEAEANAYAARLFAPVLAEREGEIAEAAAQNAQLESDLVATRVARSDLQDALVAEQTARAAERTQYEQTIAALEARPTGTRPVWDGGKADGKRVTIDTKDEIESLSGKRILCPLDIRVPGKWKIRDFEIDVTTGPALTANTSAIAINPVTTQLELEDGLVTASKPSRYAFGITGAGIVTRRMEIRNVVDGINSTGDWTDYGSHIHSLFKGKPVHADGAAANKAGIWRLYGTVFDAGTYDGGDSLADWMISPGPIAGIYAYGVTLLGGYPAINITPAITTKFPFEMVDSVFGAQTYRGGAAITVAGVLRDHIRAGLKNTRMADGSAVIIANGG